MEFLTLDDLSMFADIESVKAQQMIEDATAIAMLAAPCLDDVSTTLTTTQVAAVRAVIRGAILRWNEAGTGVLAAQTAGPFGQTIDTRQPRRGMFWPSEITQLQNICGGSGSGGAFSIDTTPTGYALVHLDTCSINFGGNCSCGVILMGGTGYYPTTTWYSQ